MHYCELFLQNVSITKSVFNILYLTKSMFNLIYNNIFHAYDSVVYTGHYISKLITHNSTQSSGRRGSLVTV